MKTFEEWQIECDIFNEANFEPIVDTRFAYVSPAGNGTSLFMYYWRRLDSNIDELIDGSFYANNKSLFPLWENNLDIFVTNKAEVEAYYRNRRKMRFTPPNKEKWFKG